MNNLALVTGNKLDSLNFSQLLDNFEKCVHAINYSRAIAYKTIEIIDSNKLWLDKNNYSKEQLQILKSEGLKEPWKASLRDVLECLYSYFSWSKYVKYGLLIQELDMSIVQRLSNDALNALNKHRYELKVLIPELSKIKDEVISKEVVLELVDAYVRRKPIKKKVIEIAPRELDARAIRAGKMAELRADIKRHKDAFYELKTLCLQMEEKIKLLESDKYTLSRELRQSDSKIKGLKQELSRFQRSR